MRSILLLVIFFGSALFLWAQTDNTSGDGPSLKLKSNTIDVGIVSGDSIISGVFTIYNVDKEPVSILHIFSDCSCAVSNYSTEPIAPGDSLQFEVSFDPANYRWGPFRRVFRIRSTGDGNRITAVLKGDIKKKYRK